MESILYADQRTPSHRHIRASGKEIIMGGGVEVDDAPVGISSSESFPRMNQSRSQSCES